MLLLLGLWGFAAL
ncbi:trans-sialidase, putative [Trypanosoma cruzi]|nr:trans-sialidase, putative [Trypanosoma cruzi]